MKQTCCFALHWSFLCRGWPSIMHPCAQRHSLVFFPLHCLLLQVAGLQLPQQNLLGSGFLLDLKHCAFSSFLLTACTNLYSVANQ